MLPLVSVIIPTYNRSELVVRAVQSVLNQTYSNIDVIVVDDASTDDTSERLSAFTDRIRYVLIPHQGRSAARNAGIEASTGEYVAFLDSDDEWFPDKVAKQVAVLKNPMTHIVYCDAYYIDANENIVRLQRERHRGNLLPHLLVDNVISGSASAVMVRRSCLERVAPFHVDWETGEDWDLWLRLAFHFNFDFVSQPLVKIRIHPNNTRNTRSAEVWARSISAVYEGLLTNPDYATYVREHWQECEATIAYFTGLALYEHGSTAAARREFLASIRYMPLQSRAYIALSKSFLSASTVATAKRVRSGLHKLFFKNP